MIPVLAAPLLDPGASRRVLDVAPGQTVAEIVAEAFPELGEEQRGRVRVALVTPERSAIVPEAIWHRTRPRPGAHVVLRVVPGLGGGFGLALTLLSVAEYAVGTAIAAAVLPSDSPFRGLGFLGLGLGVGAMLLNALVPSAEDDDLADTYALRGWQNERRPGGAIPMNLGRIRTAPPFAAPSYSEVVGADQYVRALFCFGAGPQRISDMRIGDVPLSAYDDIDVEIREGREDDDPISLYPRQVIEDGETADLARDYPRDSKGRPDEDDDPPLTPVRRITAGDTERVSVIVSFPGGLFEVDEDEVESLAVELRIRQRPASGGSWDTVRTLTFGAAQREALSRQFTWTLPYRGRWEIELTRMTHERTGIEKSDRMILTAIQSIRPERPISAGKPLTLVALRARASSQLSGTLNTFNAVAERYAPVWDGTDWTERLSRNPASAALYVLSGPVNPFPAGEDEIDWDAFADWFAWCGEKDLKYDRSHGGDAAFREVIGAIGAAGRASVRHDGTRWGVIIDRPGGLVVDHISARNASEITWSHPYFDPPDAFRVSFRDETADWESAERIVPWPGHVGPINVTEALDLPGKTDPAEIWREARRRQHELMLRRSSYSTVQSGQLRVACRGDLVRGAIEALHEGSIAAQVIAVDGDVVTIDEPVTMVAGIDYGLRFMDEVGASVLRQVHAVAGTARSLVLAGAGPAPAAGAHVIFGERGSEGVDLRVRSVRPAEGGAYQLDCVPAAPELDDLPDADNPPAWDGRYGDVGTVTGPPSVPKITSLRSAASDGFTALLAPGTGSTVPTAEFLVRHRLVGETVWGEVAIDVASAIAEVNGYQNGADVEVSAYALSADQVPSSSSAVQTIRIGEDLSEPPA